MDSRRVADRVATALRVDRVSVDTLSKATDITSRRLSAFLAQEPGADLDYAELVDVGGFCGFSVPKLLNPEAHE